MSVLGKLLGVDWLARKLGYVEQDVRSIRRDFTDLVGRVQELEGVVRDLLLRPMMLVNARETSEGYRETAPSAQDVANIVAQYAQHVQELSAGLKELDERHTTELNITHAGARRLLQRLEALEAEVRSIPRPNVVEAPRRRWGDAELTGGFCLKRTPCDEPCDHNGCTMLRDIAAFEAREPRPEPLRVPVHVAQDAGLVLTPAEVRERVAEVARVARDFEQAHSLEDELHTDVLAAIANGAENPAELADEAMATRKVPFHRVCS